VDSGEAHVLREDRVGYGMPTTLDNSFPWQSEDAS
jgi:hypothetical protein